MIRFFLTLHFWFNDFLGGHETQALMDVINSTNHMVNGGVKDAKYLAQQILPLMTKVDPDKKAFDFVLFDGAANVQKGGKVIQARFPKVIVAKGTEHVGSLFLAKVFKEPPLQLLKTWTSIVSCTFLCFFSFLSPSH